MTYEWFVGCAAVLCLCVVAGVFARHQKRKLSWGRAKSIVWTVFWPWPAAACLYVLGAAGSYIVIVTAGAATIGGILLGLALMQSDTDVRQAMIGLGVAIRRDETKKLIELRPEPRAEAGVVPLGPVTSYASLRKDADIIQLQGEIKTFTAQKFATDCEKVLASDKPSVLIMLDTCGGNVDAGRSIHEQLRLLAMIKRVAVIVVGECSSAGIWMMMAVPREQRFASGKSRFMIHACVTANNGRALTPREMDGNTQLQHDHANETWVIDEIAAGSFIRRDDLKKMVDGDYLNVYFGAEKAIELGLVVGMI